MPQIATFSIHAFEPLLMMITLMIKQITKRPIFVGNTGKDELLS